ncbi:hypothetical protein VD0004_g9175 [Verticillium dahliae]|uniref:Uncharacterized protein n=2 Tax=Verticillium dahliae TaxID=27337 RepID=G2WR54_VERDV|nr:uncharacterized protein VDAG_00037 [Verticillium dahliae VdLs.17]KAH6709796.1 hypothetical protein EV126DRAFT_353151 [Verticillium dahliae]EGY13355.1 hypothetical protein VDAG_00037 [Verticillium dahliae VdLs.17]PNH37613.1 hypothetical protein VD0004_g9175 [Verticillium dahliae]PNH51498.1 hypothetical protein VD0003_g5748 [Verticillium dahliae]PNH70674.1 hypothetical protein VD0001_g6806 [Verticillium dahliae]
MTPGQPPSTPDPRKFLLTKRHPPSSRDTTTTPGHPRQFQPSGAATAASSSQQQQQQQQQKFHATPRFAAPSSSSFASTPRPPSSAQGFAPGFGFPGTSAARRQREAIVDDGVDSSPTGVRGGLGGSIEDESSAGGRSDSEEEAGREGGAEEEQAEEEGARDSSPGGEGPTPKRRRVEIDSEEGGSQLSDGYRDGEIRTLDELDERDVRGDEDEMMLDAPVTPLQGGTEASDNEDDDNDGEEEEEEEVRDAAAARNQQPTFQRPPRFRAPEVEAPKSDGLPEAFSPQRRGVRYIPGGLAAEMQSRLAEVKGWSGRHERQSETAVQFVVEEVEAGGRMYLVRGRQLQAEAEAGGMSLSVRLMLAGEGKLTGLAKKAEVHKGVVIAIAQPAWEVTLGQGHGQDRWVVACDWAVQAG